MQQEYEALMKNNTWSLVPLPPDRKPIGCKWVFRVKENVDGSINKYKAQLVAKWLVFYFSETLSCCETCNNQTYFVFGSN